MKKMIMIFLFCFVCSGLMPQDIKWDYAVKPGSKEWQQLTTQEKKVHACQIPEELLSKISTQNLMELCLNYPLFLNVTVFSTFSSGFNRFVSDFNGINELFRRNKSAELLKEEFVKMSVKNLDSNLTILQQGKYVYDLMFIELILSQDEILRQLSKEELKLLLINSVQKYYDKKDLLNIYGEMSLKTIGLLISSIILQLDSSGQLFSIQEIQDLHAKMNINSPGIIDYMPKIDQLVNDANKLLK